MSLVLVYLQACSLSYFEYIDFHKYRDKSDSKSKDKIFQMKLTVLICEVVLILKSYISLWFL